MAPRKQTTPPEETPEETPEEQPEEQPAEEQPEETPEEATEEEPEEEDEEQPESLADMLDHISELIDDEGILERFPSARPLPPGVVERPKETVQSVSETDFRGVLADVANPLSERQEVGIDPAFVQTQPHPTSSKEVGKVGVNLTNDVPTGRGPEPPRQAYVTADGVLIYNQQTQSYEMVPHEQAELMPTNSYGVPVKELHSPLDERDHDAEHAVASQDESEVATSNIVQKDERKPFSKAARIKQIQTERGALEAQQTLTTDIVVQARASDRLSQLASEEDLLEHLPASVDASMTFGHAVSRRFRIPVPGRNEELTFENHVFETDDPYEIAAVRRLMELGSQGEDLVELETGQRAYFHRDGSFLGWEKDDSKSVERWLKQGMLRGH